MVDSAAEKKGEAQAPKAKTSVLVPPQEAQFVRENTTARLDALIDETSQPVLDERAREEVNRLDQLEAARNRPIINAHERSEAQRGNRLFAERNQPILNEHQRLEAERLRQLMQEAKPHYLSSAKRKGK